MSYCVREKKQTESVPGSERYEKAKNGRLMLKSTCTSCGIMKTKFVKQIQGEGLGDALLMAGMKTLWETGKLGAKKVLKSDATKRAASSYVRKMADDMINKGVSQTFDNLASNIPTMGSGIIGTNSFLVPKRKRKTDADYLIELHQKNPQLLYGQGFDSHKLIGKLPKPKAGFTPWSYKYMGPYNPLDKQLRYDKNTGEVIEWKVKPKNKLDEISAHHDICYDMGKNKGQSDRKMVDSIDPIPWKNKPWGTTAVRNIINTKQKLGLRVKPKNGKGR